MVDNSQHETDPVDLQLLAWRVSHLEEHSIDKQYLDSRFDRIGDRLSSLADQVMKMDERRVAQTAALRAAVMAGAVSILAALVLAGLTVAT